MWSTTQCSYMYRLWQYFPPIIKLSAEVWASYKPGLSSWARIRHLRRCQWNSFGGMPSVCTELHIRRKPLGRGSYCLPGWPMVIWGRAYSHCSAPTVWNKSLQMEPLSARGTSWHLNGVDCTCLASPPPENYLAAGSCFWVGGVCFSGGSLVVVGHLRNPFGSVLQGEINVPLPTTLVYMLAIFFPLLSVYVCVFL